MRLILLIFMIVLLVGCYPGFKQPLTPLATDSYQPCLLGSWQLETIGDEDEDDLILHFGRAEAGGFEALSVSFSQSGRLDKETVFGHISETDMGDFINFRETKNDKTAYYVMGFTLLDNQLSLRPLNTSLFTKALEDGRLQADEQSTIINNSPDEILEFFEEMAKDLFADEMLFLRISKSMCQSPDQSR